MCIHHQQKHRKIRRGMTLLEVVIAMGLLIMLVSMIYRLASSNTQLSQNVVDQQNATMERNAFFTMLKNHFEQLPGNAKIKLESFEGTNDRLLFTLTFEDVPMSFHWGNTPITAEAIELLTIQTRDGLIDVVLRLYDQKILEETVESADDPEPIAEITLLRGLALCDCEATDGRDIDNPIPYWEESTLPLYIKLYCRFEPDSDIVQQTFWIVPKENPATIMNQIIRQNPAGPDSTGGGDSDTITLPTNPSNPSNPSNPTTPRPPVPPNSGSGGGRGPTPPTPNR